MKTRILSLEIFDRMNLTYGQLALEPFTLGWNPVQQPGISRIHLLPFIALSTATICLFYLALWIEWVVITITLATRSQLGLSQVITYLTFAVALLTTWTLLRSASLGSALSSQDDRSKEAKILGKPYLIPCRTAHSRSIPKKHSFSYSYLTVGIPVGFKGDIDGLLSAEPEPPTISSWLPYLFSSRSWFEVCTEDHLERGNSGGGLRGKLDRYLMTQVGTI